MYGQPPHSSQPKASSLAEDLVHGLVSQLDTEEGSRVGRHGSGEGRPEAGEEGLVAALGVQALDDAANRDVALGRLQPALDGVDGEDGDPHGDTGTGAGAGDGRQAELAGRLARDGVDGGELLLDVLYDLSWISWQNVIAESS